MKSLDGKDRHPPLTRFGALLMRPVEKRDVVHWLALIVVAAACIVLGTISQTVMPVVKNNTIETMISKSGMPAYLPTGVLTDGNGRSRQMYDLLQNPRNVVMFYKTACPSCGEQLRELSERFGDQVGIVIVMDGEDDNRVAVKEIAELNLKNAESVFDARRMLSIACRVTTYPTTFLVKKNGEIIDGSAGENTGYMNRFDHHLRRTR